MSEQIEFDDFAKVELRAVTVLTARQVEGSEKLLHLTVNDGEGERTIVSGIAKAYAPEALIGKTILIVANLKPRTLMGIESQGMILAIGDKDLSLVTFDKSIIAGDIAH